jgi:hypothetical protein
MYIRKRLNRNLTPKSKIATKRNQYFKLVLQSLETKEYGNSYNVLQTCGIGVRYGFLHKAVQRDIQRLQFFVFINSGYAAPIYI